MLCAQAAWFPWGVTTNTTMTATGKEPQSANAESHCPVPMLLDTEDTHFPLAEMLSRCVC